MSWLVSESPERRLPGLIASRLRELVVAERSGGVVRMKVVDVTAIRVEIGAGANLVEVAEAVSLGILRRVHKAIDR